MSQQPASKTTSNLSEDQQGVSPRHAPFRSGHTYSFRTYCGPDSMVAQAASLDANAITSGLQYF